MAIQKRDSNIENILRKELEYSFGGLNYTYDSHYEKCNNYYGSYTTFSNVRIISPWEDLLNIKKEMFESIVSKMKSFSSKKKDSTFEVYILNRVLYKCINDINQFEIDIRDGYYGQEINGVHLTEVDSVIESYRAIKDAEDNIFSQVRALLELEYGKDTSKLIFSNNGILEDYMKCSIISVPFDQLRVGNGEYLIKLSDKIVKHYISCFQNSSTIKNLPIGIYRETGDGYKIVDGYHRWAAQNSIIGDDKSQKINIICFRK